MRLLLDTHIFLWYVGAEPFDRILVCQAIEHDLQIVTADAILSRYPAKIFAPA